MSRDAAPSVAGFRMPAEWAPHERTWMEMPTPNTTFGDGTDGRLARHRRAWADVANAIVRFEPATMICDVGDIAAARALLDPAVELHEAHIDDAWFRDSGPTFLTSADGRLGATHWTFNAWGKPQWGYDAEVRIGGEIAQRAGAQLFRSAMVNEGGGIHVDGEGTVLVTRTVQLDPDRNPGWTEERVEAELRAHLGVERVIWIPRGLTKDDDELGTRGHIDIVAAFQRPGVVVVHVQTDPHHPDHAVSQDVLRILRAETDATGRPLEVVELPAPTVGHLDGELVDWSYVNHYLCNGAVILCAFDDRRDDDAAAILRDIHPDREVVLVDARPIFECGGGIHCITQQQPVAQSGR